MGMSTKEDFKNISWKSLVPWVHAFKGGGPLKLEPCHREDLQVFSKIVTHWKIHAPFGDVIMTSTDEKKNA